MVQQGAGGGVKGGVSVLWLVREPSPLKDLREGGQGFSRGPAHAHSALRASGGALAQWMRCGGRGVRLPGVGAGGGLASLRRSRSWEGLGGGSAVWCRCQHLPWSHPLPSLWGVESQRTSRRGPEGGLLAQHGAWHAASPSAADLQGHASRCQTEHQLHTLSLWSCHIPVVSNLRCPGRRGQIALALSLVT